MALLDLTIPEHAYFFGFAQCDGSMYSGTRRRGRLTIEVGAKDAALLVQFAAVVPVNASVRYRTRDTNFKRSHRSVVLTICDLAFREELQALGLPVGPKSDVIAPPEVPFSERDYFRGVVDADGSLGIAGNGAPFVSLCTRSEALARAFGEFTSDVTGHTKRTGRNKRDGAFNVMSWREQAQAICDALYRDAAIALSRKAERARQVSAWTRPPGARRASSRRPWTDAEDRIVDKFSVAEAMEILRRSRASIVMRRRRLRIAGMGSTVV
jgi:hypothetical protein